MPIPGGPRPQDCPPRSLPQVAARLGDPPGAGPGDVPAVPVRGATLSSRTVRPGDLYAALPGARTHGAAFTAQAVEAGAVAVLTDPAGRDLIGRLPGDGAGVPVLVVPRPRQVLGDLAAWIYGEPGERLASFGVTGTNGKTTTTFLLDSALRGTGVRTGLIGTIEIRVGGERVLATGTTPEAPDLHALLAVMLEHGVEAVSMEISSHALDQNRVDGLVVDVAGFTNLSQDHLDYHHTMEAYFATKAELFTPRYARSGVVCVDDAWGRRLAQIAGVPVVTVRTRPQDPATALPADWEVVGRRPSAGGRTAIDLRTPAGPLAMTCPLPGDFNIANTVLALAMLVTSGRADAVTAARALEAAEPVPGRMEPVTGAGRPGEPLAVVDYAHSPDAVEAALAALAGRGRPLVVVLGAGGDRDVEKRPLMGAAAARGADVVVVTDDNPRSEPPAAIRAAVLAGAQAEALRTGAVVLEVGDRRRAVAEGVRRAWDGGVVLVAGKGHEQGQDVGGVVHPFDDRVVVHEALCTVPPPPGEHGAGRGQLDGAVPGAARDAEQKERQP